MTKGFLTTTIILAIIISITTCSTSKQNSALPRNTHWVELSRFLAGMPIPETSRLHPLTLNKSYQKHAAFMNNFWEKVARGNISAISSWREKNISGLCGKNTAFYPLSGADLVNLYSFYPEASAYIMVALEQIGSISDPVNFSEFRLNSELYSIERFIYSIASRNYLICDTMDHEMQSSHDIGVAPVLLVFAARLNLMISAVEEIQIMPDGSASVSDNSKPPMKGGGISGLRIRFMTGNGVERSIVYLQTRLKDDSLTEKSPLGLYLKNTGRFNSLLKSAIYLLHYNSYRDFCIALLDRSCILVQDDSGIPYRYFMDQDDFTVTLFGKYDNPPPLKDLTNPPRQPDLVKSYKEHSFPLDFNFGYGAKRGTGRSNLLLAKRNGLGKN